jgi:DNA-binding NtrC family response regulator
VISAANRDLKREVEKKNFREDLFYRLNVVPIELPLLRQRKNDIPLLAEEFLRQASDEGQKTAGLSKKALAIMIDYPWPGNVRELQNAIHYALVKCKGRMIRAEDLPLELRVRSSRRGPSRKLNEEMVREALQATGGNKAKAARHLGVGRATLYRFLEDFPHVS